MDIYFAGDMYEKLDYAMQCLKMDRLMSNNQKSKNTWIKHSEDLMDIYFVGPGCQRRSNEMFKLNKDFLVSFNNNMLAGTLRLWNESKPKSKFFIDSGAFTTWTQGKQVDVDGYIKFVNENDKSLTIFGQVDSIPGKPGFVASWEDRQKACLKTIENYRYMIERLVSPEKCLYTFHCHNDFKHLENFLNKPFDIKGKKFIPAYMALGGMGNVPKQERINFIDKCFQMIEKSKNPNIKVHLFGITSLDLLQYFPRVTSVDSTKWLMVAAMGSILTNNGTLYISEQKGHPLNIDDETMKNILRYGFTLEQLKTDTVYRCLYNATWLEEKIKNLQFKKLLKLNKLF